MKSIEKQITNFKKKLKDEKVANIAIHKEAENIIFKLQDKIKEIGLISHKAIYKRVVQKMQKELQYVDKTINNRHI